MSNVIEKKNRGDLGEGRSSGMGFAFLKKAKGDEFHTVQPLSPCKDYLNEVVFTENTGIGSQAHGLVYPKKNDIFNEVAYLAIKIVPDHGSTSYMYGKTIDIDKQHLKDNHKNLEKLMNYFEEQLDIVGRTFIEEANDDYFILRVPVEWTHSTVNISLYSLIVRIGMVYTAEEDPMTFLKNYKYNSMDKDLLNGIRPKLTKILENKKLIPQPPFDEKRAKEKQWNPHDVGIWSTSI